MLNREYDQEVEHRVIREEAKAEGIEQGENFKAIEIAKKMILRGDEIADITELTSLTEIEVEKLME